MSGRIRLYLAPALLVVVAAMQFAAARQGALSPWKGGGFGMFSTVDSPSARFLRIYLVEDDRETAVLLPRELNALARQVRTVPDEESLRQLAIALSEKQWTPYRLSTAINKYEQLRNQQIDSPNDRPVDQLSVDDAFLPQPQRYVISFDQISLYRTALPEEDIAAENQVRFQGVRVELWGYMFDGNGPRLTASRLLEAAATNPVDSR